MTYDRPKILAIDDTPANLMVLASGLSNDFLFQLATSGASGLAMAESSPPDLVLLDIMMPEMDGFETCRRFKQHPKLKDIPIVFVTALSDTGSEVHGLNLGVVDYLHKPVNVDIARQRIRNLIERDRLAREVAAYRDHLEVLVAERTERLQIANTELRAAQVATECANRAKNAFLANMSHELRTPLNAILGMNFLIKQKMTDRELVGKSEKLAHAGEQLLGIINGILQLSKLEGDTATLNNEKFNVRELIEIALANFYSVAQSKGLALRHAVAPEVPQRVHGLSSGLRQAIENFLSNAVKFSDRGTITVRVLVQAVDDANVTLRFEVEDQGIGISQEDVARLFDKFTQADESATRPYGGIGIGLAINRHLATLMGGEVGVRSTLGQGSCFWLTAVLRRSLDEPAEPLELAAADVADAVTNELVVAERSPLVSSGVVEHILELLVVDDLDAKEVWTQSRQQLLPLLGERAVDFEKAMDDFAFHEAATILLEARADNPELLG